MQREQIPIIEAKIATAKEIIAVIDELKKAKQEINGVSVQEITIDIDAENPAIYISGNNGEDRKKIPASPAMLTTIKNCLDQIIDHGIRNSEDALARL